jgi:hypothetical protein
VYEKTDEAEKKTARLNIRHAIFIDKSRTGDHQTTTGILKILANNGNRDDLIAFFEDKDIPGGDLVWGPLADEVLERPPVEGYVTISNALQWRLQYSRAIQIAGSVDGLIRVR